MTAPALIDLNRASSQSHFAVRAYLMSALMVAVALGCGLLFRRFFNIEPVALVFVPAILGSAIAYGLWPSFFSCLACVLAYDFFFIPPIYSFTIANPDHCVALFFFAAISLIVSNLAVRLRDQAIAAYEQAQLTETLFRFTRKLSSAITLYDLLRVAVLRMASILNVRVVMLLPKADEMILAAASSDTDSLDDSALAAAKWAAKNGRPAGRGADSLPGVRRLFLPIVSNRTTLAVLGMDRDSDGPILLPQHDRFVTALIDQIGIAIERIHLSDDLDRARLATETDRLRTALLTSISHDLRTPLASILGAATSLESWDERLSQGARQELLATIREEAERLNRFIANLLDMTKLESGIIAPRFEHADVSDAIGAVLARSRGILAAHKVALDIASDLPMLEIDVVLFEQALFNLLDNAAKYAPGGSTITILAWRDGDFVYIRIVDEGIGIPSEDIERVFDKFYRVKAGDRTRAGTGLGLAVCRGFVEAMRGTITATNLAEHQGAVFTIAMPVRANDDQDISANQDIDGVYSADG